MCYLVAKKFGSVGCSALQTTHGQHLVELKKRIIDKVGIDRRYSWLPLAVHLHMENMSRIIFVTQKMNLREQ